MKDGFFELPAEVTTALGTLAGFAFLGKLTINQQNALGNLLELTGQVMLANAAQQQLMQQTPVEGLKDRLEALERRLEKLEESRLEG